MVKAVKDDNRPYKCATCGKKFRGVSGLWYHKQTHGYKPKSRGKNRTRPKTTRPKRQKRIVNSGGVSKLVDMPSDMVCRANLDDDDSKAIKIHMSSARGDDLKWLDAVYESDARNAALQCFSDWDLPVSAEPCNGPSCTWLHLLPVCENQT